MSSLSSSSTHDILVLNAAAVDDLLTMTACIDLVARALRCVSRGGAIQPIRTRIVANSAAGFMGWMPGRTDDPPALGIKVVSVFDGNFERGLPSHWGMVILFDDATGRPLALVDGGEVTAIRTAAASAVATDILARADATRLAVLGYGTQAARHVEAMLCVRPITNVSVWGRSPARAAAFAADIAARYGIIATAVTTVAEAMADADIVCTTTAASEPILAGRLIPPGCHLNVVGSSFPDAREVDDEAVVWSRFYVDYRAMTEAAGGEYLHALQAGLIGADHILGEIGAVLDQAVPGRTAADDVTMFKSLGMAAEDLICADFLYRQAVELRAQGDPRVQAFSL